MSLETRIAMRQRRIRGFKAHVIEYRRIGRKDLVARCEEIIREDQAVLDNLLFQQAETELAEPGAPMREGSSD